MPSHTPRPDGAVATAESESVCEARAREALILGMPLRILPLKPDEISAEAYEIRRKLRRAVSAATGSQASRATSAAGEVPEMIAIMLRHPDLFRSHIELGAQLLGDGALSARDRELAILRTGWLCKAPFEWGEHVVIGRQLGLTGEDFERITRGSTAPGWDEHDRAVLRAAEELHADAMISDETWSVLSRTLDDKQLIELPLLVGQYHAVAYYQNTLRIRLLPDNLGLSAR